MRTSSWLSGRRTAGVLAVCLLVWGAAPPPAAAQCEAAKLLASDGAGNDLFGFSVSVSGDVAVVGALGGDGIVASSGSAYMFVGLFGLDYNGNGVSDVCEALSGADITGSGGVPDGSVDAFDLGALLAAWCSVAGGNPCGTCFGPP